MTEANDFDEQLEPPGLALSDWQSEILEEIESSGEDVYADLTIIHREWTGHRQPVSPPLAPLPLGDTDWVVSPCMCC